MARQKGFGAEIAAEIMAEGVAGEGVSTSPGDVLESRGRALSRLGDETVYDQYEWVDPAICRPSVENARVYSDLNYENCAELIDSFKAEGKQRFPAIVRRTSDPEVPFEIVAGMRRHFAVSWLRSHNYPDFKYLINIQQMDDEAAFRLSDLENRARADITDVERGESYGDALRRHYDNNVGLMAERLNISPKTLRRYLDLAELGEAMISALGGKVAAKVSHAREIKPEMLKGREQAEAMRAEAEVIAREQEERRATGEGQLAAADVIKRLKAASVIDRRGKRHSLKPVEIKGAAGKPLLEYVAPAGRLGFTLKVPTKPDGTSKEIRAAIFKIVDEIYGK
jgi:ParB family chromosome partitioning protein